MVKKLRLSYKDIEQRLKVFKDDNVSASEVGYNIFYAFGKSPADIRRYKENKGIIKNFDGILIKDFACYKESSKINFRKDIEYLKNDIKVIKASPKLLIVSDGADILAYDTRENNTYENSLNRIYCNFDFFYPLMGVEQFHSINESDADIKAAEKLAKLHDELRAYNDFNSDSDLHDLNIFITRLLFCFFAEDTGIFEKNLFTSSIERYTNPDGSDVSDYLEAAFNIMDVRVRSKEVNEIIRHFPYVNGGLFSDHISIPKMGAKARRIIIECGELDWENINPDIFGSMIQAVVNPEDRAENGMHYTSVPNIMKVIQPLFLDELKEEYAKLENEYTTKRQIYDVGGISKTQFYKDCEPIARNCTKLLIRMSHIKFFDPACGSGNFLIITYKMLRLLEMDILKLEKKCHLGNDNIDFINGSCITIDQFYGIELLDFPHEVATLSLWLAEHQMDNKFHENFGVDTKALPLHTIHNIKCGNACRLDWNTVCPHDKDDEVYVFGNPPYLGSKLQSVEQKKDISNTFNSVKNCKILDYIAIWFYLGSEYIKKTSSEFAFVSTNSICQGEQVSVLWPLIKNNGGEISFAHTSFKWSNNAKHNAGVTVVIIGVKCLGQKEKVLFTNNKRINVKNINPYLSSANDVIVYKSTKTPKGLPKLCFGSMPYDNGFLLMNRTEYEAFINEYPDDAHFIKRIYGSEEFINGIFRYCLWINDEELDIAKENPEIAKRINETKEYRLTKTDAAAIALAQRPHQFREHPSLEQEKIIIPSVSSERRKYIPMGYLRSGTVISNSAFAIYDAKLWLFGILTSKIHMAWVRTVGGKLKTDYRYSAGICYNTFPFPKISDAKKSEIEEAATEVLLTREDYPERTLAEMYDPEKMPNPLREAHSKLDDIVDSCYPGYPFVNDEARLECLFKLYEKMTEK